MAKAAIITTAPTESIMPNNPPLTEAASMRPSLVPAICALVVGFFLLVPALFFTTAHLSSQNLPDALAGRSLDLQNKTALPALQAQLGRSLSLYPARELAQSQNLLSLSMARHKQLSWQEAAAHIRANLAYHPQDTMSWGRLAYAHAQAGARDQAIAALLMSFDTGPYIRGFMGWRMTMALQFWPQLNEAARRQVAQQAGFMWKHDRWDFIKLGRLGPFRATTAELMQTYHPEESAAFLKRQRWVKPMQDKGRTASPN